MTKYTADDIKILNWPDPIRKRPGMYMKALGTEGCLDLVQEVVESMLSTELGGNATLLKLRISRHNEIIISYNGSGMPIGVSKNEKVPHPNIYRALMSLSTETEKPAPSFYKKYGHLSDVGPIFNSACESLRITTIVEGMAYSVTFTRGCISSCLSESFSDEGLNQLRFKFDSDVMGEFNLDIDTIKRYLQPLKLKNGDVCFEFKC